jgi:putative copper resistance protein D
LLWFLRDYPLAAVVLRAATLAFQSIVIGGLVFCSVILRTTSLEGAFRAKARRLIRGASVGLIVTQLVYVSLDSAMLMGTSSLHLADLLTANYVLAGALAVVTAVALLWSLHRAAISSSLNWFWFAVPLLVASVWTSHAASRLDDRAWLIVLTGIHQLATALWIGSLPYIWMFAGLGQDPSESQAARVDTLRRYSKLALSSAVALVLAGIGMAYFYVGSWDAVDGTAYGVVLTAKCILLVGLLVVGAGNFFSIRKFPKSMQPAFLRICHATEAEIGIGFTIILAAASLTSQPPAVDQVQDRLTTQEIVARMSPRWPRLTTPSISAMPPVQPMAQAIRNYDPTEDTASSTNNPTEQAWSEYNHHWAGIVVLLAGICALLARSRKFLWARNWPLVFLGLAIFLFFRADPEAWPLGPRGFWQSFYNPEDLEHRLYVLLILSFVAFEWGVQTGRILSRKAALVFPAVCALGGALLLTHSHSLGDVKDELLAQMTHTAIAICAVFAGWARWLQLRQQGRSGRIAAWIWPVCLILIGMILLDYREA